MPNADPHKTRASRKGTTFNRWLKKAIVNGMIGAKAKPVGAPKINRLVVDNPINHIKTSQATTRPKLVNQTIFKHTFTDTYADATAVSNRPIYLEEKKRSLLIVFLL